jgi:hypothetical protein
MTDEPVVTVIELLQRLKLAKIYSELRYYRDDAISVDVAVPGQRWEIDVFSDGRVEVEVFQSDGTIHDGEILDDLIPRFSD